MNLKNPNEQRVQKGKKMVNKKNIRITVTAPYLDGMQILIKDGLYETQAEILKDALRRLFIHYQITCINDACAEKVAVA